MPALAIKDLLRHYFGQYQIDVIDFAREVGKIDDKIIMILGLGFGKTELTTNLNVLLDSFNHLTRSNTVMKLFFK